MIAAAATRSVWVGEVTTRVWRYTVRYGDPLEVTAGSSAGHVSTGRRTRRRDQLVTGRLGRRRTARAYLAAWLPVRPILCVSDTGGWGGDGVTKRGGVHARLVPRTVDSRRYTVVVPSYHARRRSNRTGPALLIGSQFLKGTHSDRHMYVLIKPPASGDDDPPLTTTATAADAAAAAPSTSGIDSDGGRAGTTTFEDYNLSTDGDGDGDDDDDDDDDDAFKSIVSRYMSKRNINVNTKWCFSFSNRIV